MKAHLLPEPVGQFSPHNRQLFAIISVARCRAAIIRAIQRRAIDLFAIGSQVEARATF
jgi:hypothetical protein